MSDALGRIGPNAVLQLVPVLEARAGPAATARVLAAAGLHSMPSASGLMDERLAVRLHQAVRAELPDAARSLLREAGIRTAEYVLSHRIPAPARRLLRALPAPLAAPLLARAIARHAWTFAGSGRFAVQSLRPPVFTLRDNPLTRGERADRLLCEWHVAVFERLYHELVSPRWSVAETACCAAGSAACRFEVVPARSAPWWWLEGGRRRPAARRTTG